MNVSEKRIQIHRLLWKLGLLESKVDILCNYGVKSTVDLSDNQVDELIARLKNSINNRYNVPNDVRTWRSNALSLINMCGIYANNNDWSNVNRFMLNPRICGKLLYELTVEELKDLCRKLRVVAAKKEKQDKYIMLNHTSLN